MHENEDSLLSGKVRLLQRQGGYRTAIDPVFLAAAVLFIHIAKNATKAKNGRCGVLPTTTFH